MTDERKIYKLFKLGVLLKGCFSIVDIIGSALLHFMGTNTLVRLTTAFAQGELLEDTDDSIARWFLRATPQLTPNGTAFVVVYLLVHGLTNAVLVLGLLRNKRWAYPFTLMAMSTFMLYQLYRLAASLSPWLFMLTLFDLAIIWLVWHEYRRGGQTL